MKKKLLTSSFLAGACTLGLGVLPTFATSTMAPPPPPPPPMAGKATPQNACSKSTLEKMLNKERKAGNIELKASVSEIAEDMAKEGEAKPLAEKPTTAKAPAKPKGQGASPAMMDELQAKLNKKKAAG